MMKLLDNSAPTEVTRSPHHAEALIREAKQRERRRRIGLALAVLLVIAVVALLVGVVGGGSPKHSGIVASPSLPKGAPTVDAKAFAQLGLLAFASNGALYVLDGSNATLRVVGSLRSGAEEPSFSHDERFLAYIAAGKETPVYGGYDEAPYAPEPGPLVLARADGGSPLRIGVVGSVSEAIWNPRTDLVLAVSGADYSYRTVWIVSTDGTAHRLFSADDIYGAVWSPSGQQVAVSYGGKDALSSTLETIPTSGGRPTLWLRTAAANSQWLVPLGWWKDQGIAAWIGGNGTSASGEGTLSGAELALLRAPGARLRQLGATPAIGVVPAAGASTGWLAFEKLAPNSWGRTPWAKGGIETCSPNTDRCHAVIEQPSATAIDPVWSSDGRTLAFVEASASSIGSSFPNAVRSWYASERLYLLKEGSTRPVLVPHSAGATAPQSSPHGNAFVYVANDALYLVRKVGSPSVRVAGPLLPRKEWNKTYYGQVDWRFLFAWAA